MASIKQIANCMGLSGRISVVHNFFGYAKTPPWTLAPSQSALPQSLSLLKQVRLIKGRHVHLNIIRVGTDGNGLLSAAEEEAIDCAVQITRNIYAAVNLGIGRVERWWHIPLADNTGYDFIDSDGEAEDLVDEYSVGNDGIDIFYVPVYDGSTLGLYPWKGDGVVVEILTENFLQTARTTAHELGHFAGLGHENDKPENLMCQSKHAHPMPASIQLNTAQVEEIRGHDKVKVGC